MNKSSLILALSIVFTISNTKVYTQDIRQIAFSELQGSGSWSDPLIIGPVSKPTMIVNCPPLASGTYLNKSYIFRYFKITLENPPTAQAAIGAVVRPTGNVISAVHPRLASLRGLTLLRSSADGFWVGNPESDEMFGRYIPLAGIEPGTYMLGVEKMDSPLRSVQTPAFTLLIVP